MKYFDICNENDRDMLVNIIGNILLFTRRNKLSFEQFVKECGKHFIHSTIPQSCNVMAQKYENYLISLEREIILGNYEKANSKRPDRLKLLHEIGNYIVNEIPSEGLSIFEKVFDLIEQAHDSGDKELQNSIFKEMETFNEEMRKYLH